MKIIAAYFLAILGGNPFPEVEDIKKIFAAVDVHVEEWDIQRFIDSVAERDLFDIIESGKKQLERVHAAREPPKTAVELYCPRRDLCEE